MTRVDISPEQLNAEAAASLASDGRESYAPLPSRIVLHRLLAHDEATILRLHVRDGERGWGMAYNPSFERWLEEHYGTAYPWHAGLLALRSECRRRHADHTHRAEWSGSLCYALVNLVCRNDWSWEAACFELWVTPENTEATMQRALRRIEETMDELQARATEVVKSSEGRHDFMASAHVHRPLDGLHAVECPQCARAA